MNKQTKLTFPFQVGKQYEYIGENDDQFYKGGFFLCVKMYEDRSFLFKGTDGEDYVFESEWSDDNPVQDSFKFI